MAENNALLNIQRTAEQQAAQRQYENMLMSHSEDQRIARANASIQSILQAVRNMPSMLSQPFVKMAEGGLQQNEKFLSGEAGIDPRTGKLGNALWRAGELGGFLTDSMAGPFAAASPAAVAALSASGLARGRAPGVLAMGTGPAKAASEVGPVFYSGLERAVDNIKFNKSIPSQWLGTIKNAPGVKKDELEWSGIEEWLKSREGHVTKAEIKDYLKTGGVQVQEVLHESPRVIGHNMQGHPVEEYSTGPAATRFSDRVLPGGENYRELLLTLPENKRPKDFRLNEFNGDKGRVYPEKYFDTLEEAEAEGIRRGGQQVTHIRGGINHDNFTGGHFPEANVLAHIRFNERTDVDGKRVMFLEEVQSDWHQKGRKGGYKPSEARAVEIKTRQKQLIHDSATQAEKDEWEALQRELYPMASASNIVPDAPFKTTWHELAFKRSLRWAAENGFDRIAWTTGAQQADRYDLSKQVDAVSVTKLDGGTFTLGVRQKGAKLVEALADKVPQDKLSEYVGKDLAKKIVEQKRRDELYSGIDLKVGGEGMAGFYDKMLPDFANKYTKKWGGKVGETKLNSADKKLMDEDLEGLIPEDDQQRAIIERATQYTPNKIKVHSLDITPQMRQEILKGQPLFEGAPLPDVPKEEPKRKPKEA